MSGDLELRSRPKLLTELIRLPSLTIFILFLLLGVIFTLLSPSYRLISLDNMAVYLGLGAEFNIVALAVGLLMITGEFDLSVGSIMVFCSFVVMKLVYAGVNIYLASAITLAIGAGIGYLNGFITVRARIPSFITTLGTMMFWRGVTVFWSEGLQKPFDTSTFGVFSKIFSDPVGGVVPVQFLWFIGIAAILWFLLHRRPLGNRIYVTGDNPLAARAMGINTKAIKMGVFALVGLVCSFVAIMQIARTGAFTSRAGDGWELKSIAAAVVGGTALTGGIGSVAGIFWGALIVSLIENGLLVMRIPYFWTYTVFGVVIVGAAILSAYMVKKRAGFGRESG
ncbi:MAG: ABC transporter permease [Rectinemataceae bacterium]